MNSKPDNNFNSVYFIFFLIKWHKILLLVFFISLIASIVFSMPYFITPKYKSTVILFPVSTNSISKALLSEDFGAKKDILEFGDEEQSEQMLQILKSNEIRTKIIEKYNLDKHYNIPENAKHRMTRLYKEYDNNITFRRTEYMAVEINVMDKNPQLAADIANDIADQLDTLKNKIQKERSVKGLEIVENEYYQLKQQIAKLEDSIQVLRKMGILDYESQAEVLSEQYAIALSKNNIKVADIIQEKLDILANYGTAYISLRNTLEILNKQLISVKNKYNEAKIDAEKFLPQKFVVSKAFKAEKKSYPVRWLIVLVSVLSSLFLTILFIILYEKLMSYKKNIIHSSENNINI